MTQTAEKRPTKTPTPLKDAGFNWDDPLDLDGELTEEERMVRDTARGYAQDKLMPRVLEAYRHEKFDRDDLPRDGRARPARRDDAGGIWRRRAQLCLPTG